jgi:hypothetical protein
VTDWLLYCGIKNLLRCDEAEVVEEIARYVISQHRALRVVSRFVERTRRTPIPALLTLMAWTRSFLVVSPKGPLRGVAWIARLSNERRALEPLIASAPDLEWTELKFQSRVSFRDAVGLTIKNLKSIPRVYKIARRMHLRFESFKAMRVIELLGYYARYLELFRRGDFAVAVTSNHSNPHGIAFNLAAQKCGVPVVLISHGMPIRPVARLKYALGVVYCEAAGQTYLDEGCQIDCVLTHGRKHDYAPLRALPSQINVGIFLCKDVNELRLTSLVENLLANERVARILIRPHPKNLWRNIDAWIASHADGRLSRSSGSTVRDDLRDLHLVFGGNSSVLIEAVTAGVPSAYVDDLDHGPADLHGFVAAGLIYRSDVDPNLDEIVRFYDRPDWSQTLQRFANIVEDEETAMAKTVEAITDFVMSASTTYPPATAGGTDCVQVRY